MQVQRLPVLKEKVVQNKQCWEAVNYKMSQNHFPPGKETNTESVS